MSERKVHLSEESGGLVSSEPLCVTVDGKPVPCDDPAANVMIAAAGTPIDPKLVKLYGLKASGEKKEEKVEEKAEEAKPGVENKAEEPKAQPLERAPSKR